MKASGKTVVGNQRKNNEDCIYVSSKKDICKNLLVVADGMGGHMAGEVASRTAIETFIKNMEEHNPKLVIADDIFDILIEAVNSVNTAVYEKSQSDSTYAGMGTTFTSAIILEGKLYVTHVGDSRLYLLRDGELKQMTKDHSYVMEMVRQGNMTYEESLVHPNRNIITRAIGTHPTVDIDMVIEVLNPNDIIMLCSDGLTNMVNTDNIKRVLKKKSAPSAKVDELINLANSNGGIDNISVIVAKWEG